jgi:hypothetical protein
VNPLDGSTNPWRGVGNDPRMPETYTVESIAALAEESEDGEHALLIRYRDSLGDRRAGELLTCGYSLAGVPILQVGSFTNWVYPKQVYATERVPL